MSTRTNQRSAQTVGGGSSGTGGESGGLSEQRAQLDRLFAAAERAFDGLDLSNSQEFLNASRQTGGQ